MKFSRKGVKPAKIQLRAAGCKITSICIYVPFVLFMSFVVIKFRACPKGMVVTRKEADRGRADRGHCLSAGGIQGTRQWAVSQRGGRQVHKGAKLVKHRQWIRKVQLDKRITLFLCVLAPLREILNNGYELARI